jgi:hypothetical protein
MITFRNRHLYGGFPLKTRRLLGVMLLAVFTSFGLVAPAVAASYGPHTGSATVSKTRVVQGNTVRVSGAHFCANTAVKVTVTRNHDTYISRTIHANGSGVASTTVRLIRLGTNHIKLSGCYAGPDSNGHQNLSATVEVVPHGGSLHVSDRTVNMGDTVSVSGTGFCAHASVKVRVYDDGRRYQAKMIKANSHGKAATSVKLTRKGRTTITFQACRKAGGNALKSATVKVRKGHSFRSSPSAYMGDLARSVQPASYAVAGGSLLLLLGTTQLMLARRRRSS